MTSRTDRGADAVEFALVLPVLVAILLGIVDFGYAFFLQGGLAEAAREGARSMAITKVQASAAAAAKAAAPVTLTDAQVSVPATCPNGGVAVVTLSYPTKGLTGLWPAAITITGKGSMRCNG